ncbi:hypothetical protein [Micromonospora sp. CPCC 206061]|uniref:hypothetical protein n=1 Tax=Micromonospora sp. CPCC 206061 TaxID=3122410 RepID=UPI002FEF4FA2
MTVAFWLQLAAVLALLLMVGLVVAYAVYFDGQISRAVELVPEADPEEVSGERVGNIVTSVVMGVMILAVGVWLAATAVPVLRGSNVARILVFVAAGAHLLLCAAPCLGGAALAPIFLAGAPEEPSEGPYVGQEPWEESRFIETLYSQTLPFEDGFFLGMTVGFGIEVLLVIAVVVLLAVPPASRYFVPRRPPPAWPGAYAMPAGAAWPMRPSWPGASAVPHPGLPYVICPDPSIHETPPPGDTPGTRQEQPPGPDNGP